MTLRIGVSLLAFALPACAGAEQSGPGNGGVASFPGEGSEGGGDSSAGGGSTGITTDPGADSGSSGVGDTTTGGDPPDLDAGTWSFENVSMTPVMGFHPRRAVATGGREIVAWAEGAQGESSTLNIHAATHDGSGWTSIRLTDYEGVQNTFPFMVAVPTPVLAWTGRRMVGDDDDVFIAVAEANGWSAIRNVSDALEPAIEARADLRPALAANADGALAIAYLSAGITDAGVDPTPEVFVSEFTLAADPTKRFALVNSTTTTCNDIAGAAAPSGVFHFVLLCVQGGASVLLQATNRSGEWTTDALSGLGTAILSPSMAPSNTGVHLTWVQRKPCGADSCYEVFHAATTDEVFGTPVAVTDQANLDERKPTVGVDPWGRVLVAHQAAVDGAVGLYLSVSDDGGATFTSHGRISPGGTADDYQTPTSIGFDEDGAPSFALEVLAAGSDPLNVDIYVARFVAD